MKRMIIFFILLMVVPVQANIILPSQDTYTDSANPTVNHSTEGVVHLKKTDTVEMQGFIQFPLTAIPAGTALDDIYEMNLKLFPSQVIHGGTIEVYIVGGVWSESTLNHNNRPQIINRSMGTIPISTGDTSIHVTLDLTEVMGMWLPDRTGNFGLMLKPTNNLDMYFRAKEKKSPSYGYFGFSLCP